MGSARFVPYAPVPILPCMFHPTPPHLRLGLDPVAPPDVHAVPPHQHRVALRIPAQDVGQHNRSPSALPGGTDSGPGRSAGQGVQAQSSRPGYSVAMVVIVVNTALSMTYRAMASRSRSVSSHSRAVFSMMGTTQLL